MFDFLFLISYSTYLVFYISFLYLIFYILLGPTIALMPSRYSKTALKDSKWHGGRLVMNCRTYRGSLETQFPSCETSENADDKVQAAPVEMRPQSVVMHCGWSSGSVATQFSSDHTGDNHHETCASFATPNMAAMSNDVR
jgi:hypothetical protein